MKKIAVEEHYLIPELIEHLRSRKEAPYREMVTIEGKQMEKEWWSPTNYSVFDPGLPNKAFDLGQIRLKEMDDNGIDAQLISLSFPSVEGFDAANGTRLAKLANDRLAIATREYPQRFAGLAAIAPQDPEAAANELERAVKQLGFHGAMVTGNISGDYFDNPKFWPIFEVAESLGVPIYIHPRPLSPEMIKPYVVHPVLALAVWGFGVDAGLHAMRLIASGVFDRYPNLKIVLGHLGESLPFWLWRFDSRWPKGIAENNYQPFIRLKKNPSQYVKDNFYVTTSGMFWPLVLQFVCMALGAEKVLFAVDYPYEDTKDAVEFINSAPISDLDKEKICHINAEKLFKL